MFHTEMGSSAFLEVAYQWAVGEHPALQRRLQESHHPVAILEGGPGERQRRIEHGVSTEKRREGRHRSRSSARWRKAAICPRVTKPPGQNRSLSGGLQPFVIPTRARLLMWSS